MKQDTPQGTPSREQAPHRAQAGKPVLERIYATFGEVARSIGYSPIHGKIIAALVVNNREMSLQGLAKETGYSISMISLSLDLLEIMGVVRKSRKRGDRNLYISLHGDLLETLKNAVVMRLRKSIDTTLADISSSQKVMDALPHEEREKAMKSVAILKKEIRRLEMYVDVLSAARLP
jgi:DNA-binding transcriptional regulator GbsR (MarR family)